MKSNEDFSSQQITGCENEIQVEIPMYVIAKNLTEVEKTLIEKEFTGFNINKSSKNRNSRQHSRILPTLDAD
jgi:hypothetical protein